MGAQTENIRPISLPALNGSVRGFQTRHLHGSFEGEREGKRK